MVKNIKSRILLILLFIILIIVGGLAIHEKLFKVYPEDILKKVSEVKSYSSDVTYLFKNQRIEYKEDGKQIYHNKYGMKLCLSDREQIYKDDKIVIKYTRDNKTYEVDKDYDEFYKYTFINEIQKFLTSNSEAKYSYETYEGKKCVIVEFNTLSGNDNIYKEILIIDAKKAVPLRIDIYSKKEEERVTIYFKNFDTSGTVQKQIFD